MMLSCLFGRHWPIAAFEARRAGPETSQCADCGTAMTKDAVADWRAVDDIPMLRRCALLRLATMHVFGPDTRKVRRGRAEQVRA